MFKKYITCAVAVLFFCVCTYAQLPLSVGINGTNDYPLGSENYLDYSAGGGITGELGIPLPFLKIFGVSAHVQAAYVHPCAAGGIGTWYDVSACGGAWVNLPLLFLKGLSVRPEMCWGAVFHIVQPSFSNSKLNGVYTDQMLQFACGIRYELPISVPLALDAAPVYTVIPEQDRLLQTLGFRLSVLYMFGRQKKTASKQQ
jgi:hypothetical protein